MAATSAMMTLSGSAVAAPACNHLSSRAAFGSSGVQQACAVRPCAKAAKVVVARASSNNEERSPAKPQMLVALVAAGAALALTATPVSPAHAGLFGGNDVNVERGSSSNFPGNEGTGNKVGNNTDVRGSAGTPLGEGAGNKVGENAATRGSASTGTPFGEGNLSGSGSGAGIPNVAEKAKGAVGGLPNPFNQGPSAPDVQGAASGAKGAASNVAGVLKDKLPGGVN